MTITSPVSRVDCPGNGSSTQFSFSPVTITEASDLAVWMLDNAGNQTLLAQGATSSNYSVTVPAYPGTGYITYPASGGTPLASGWKLTIKQRAPLLQEFQPANQGPFLASSFGDAFDYAMLNAQDLREQIGRTIIAPETDTGNFAMVLPTPAARAGGTVGFDGSGNLIVQAGLVPSTLSVSTAVRPALAAATTEVAMALLGRGMYANVAALEALTSSTQPEGLLVLLGYNAINDGGEGVFTLGATTTADGGTIFNDASGRSWYRLFMKSGPGYNVRWFGATGNGTTADDPAIQACINYCQTAGVGPVYIPNGNYNITAGLTVTGNGLNIDGQSMENTLLQASVASINVLTFSGVARGGARRLLVACNLVPTAAIAILNIQGCVECHYEELLVLGGWSPIVLGGSGADCTFNRITCYNGYGPNGNIYIANNYGSYWTRTKADQPWPQGGPPVAAGILGAWAGTTAVTGTELMSITNGGQTYYLQCIGGGTTGGTEPVIHPYGTNFVDGTVTWCLAMNAAMSAINIDTAGGTNDFTDTDMTGAYSHGISLTNTGSGLEPQLTVFKNGVIGTPLGPGVNHASGAGTLLEGLIIQSAIDAYGAGIGISNGDIITVRGCLIWGCYYGIYISAGTNLLAYGNQIFGATYGVYVANNVSQFSIVDNLIGNSGTWGHTVDAIVIVGTNNSHYIVEGNNVGSCSTSGVTDNGTGSPKSVTGNA